MSDAVSFIDVFQYLIIGLFIVMCFGVAFTSKTLSFVHVISLAVGCFMLMALAHGLFP